MNYKILLRSLYFFLWMGSLAWSQSTLYRDLLPNDSRYGVLTAREVKTPNRASLDLAAWDANPLMAFPGKTGEQSLDKRHYKSMPLLVSSPISQIAQNRKSTALAEKTWQQPCSFSAMKRALSMELGWNLLSQLQARIDSIPGLQLSRVYYQKSKAQGQPSTIWIEVQLDAWTSIQGVLDLDKDGYSEFYIQISADSIREKSQAFEKWIEEDYMGKKLDSSEVLQWAQQLAGYWYPSLNTDLVWDLPKQNWPGTSLIPTIAIRGNPFGTPHHTLLKIAGLGPIAQRNSASSSTSDDAIPAKKADRNLPENYTANMERFQQELLSWNGNYEDWVASLKPLHSHWTIILSALPAQQMGLVGESQWLFFRRGMESVLGGDIGAQAKPYAPQQAIQEFREILEGNEVNFLFVPIPNKSEIYPEKVSASDSNWKHKILNPWGRKFLLELQENGTEIVDLLPPFIAQSQDTLYQMRDTHWNTKGMLIAAEQLARRIQQYDWYKDSKPNSARFTTHDTTYIRLGDIVERLPAAQQAMHVADTLIGKSVFIDGTTPYSGPRNAPILLIGDSFTGVMESVDCRNGGIGAHLARLTGLDVEVITSWGGGPNVRAKVLKARQKQLKESTRLVIYMMTARDLYHYPDGWQLLTENQ